MKKQRFDLSMKLRDSNMNSIRKNIIALLLITASALSCEAQQVLSSSLAAEAFYQTGYKLYADNRSNIVDIKQAMILYNAAVNLDRRADYVPPEIINLAWEYPQGDFSEAVKFAFDKYMDIGRTADLEVASKAVKYLLEKLGSREEREKLLQELLQKYEKVNPFFASELATQLGFLRAETADNEAAQRFLMYAFGANKYNRAAFNMLSEFTEAQNKELPAIVYLQCLRSVVTVNPLDLSSAYEFSRLAESLSLYAPASAGYRYCTQTYKHLKPNGSMPAEYYRPWALSCYNMQNYRLCREVLEQVRAYGVFDVMVEAITASAAKQSGDITEGQTIFNNIKSRGQRISTGQMKTSADELQDYAWFYCFVNDSNAQDMLVWATKAYEVDNNSVSGAAFLAYALIRNGQLELAKPMLEKIGTGTQIATIAKAEVLDANNNDDEAIKLLKSAIEAGPGTFEAQKAKNMLKQLGSEYVPAIDAAALETALANEFGQNFFSQFVPPEKMITMSLKTPGTAFSYGSTIDAQLAIVNNYTEPMVVSPDGIFKGNIRVDVRLSGDLQERFDSFILKTVRPSYEIKPGSALFVPLQFASGELKPILDCYPQANLNIEITVYVDPQKDAKGEMQNIFGTEPVKVVLKRRKLELDTLYLQQRFDALKTGKQGQKIKSAQLFAGLLAEQQRLAAMSTRYRFLYCEPGLLTSALARCLNEDDWVLKVETMAALQNVKLDYRLIESISAQLDYKEWPVRLLSLFILADKQGPNFLPVLEWIKKNESDPLVKDLAAVLSGTN
ncbi:MAG: hypothetical protein A2Y10_18180 [Planctomycetes bacterium GWF2_41_51]|nr:MAG: hypothetical protein A2Y10_18180 [Planctomycetes bacterium GWF2_41_51]HBG27521.1 hypothetical protein [Phycisphaerales bacterium]